MKTLKRLLLIFTVIALSLSLSVNVVYCKPAKDKKAKKEAKQEAKQAKKEAKALKKLLKRALKGEAPVEASSAKMIASNINTKEENDEETNAALGELLERLSRTHDSSGLPVQGKPGISKKAQDLKPSSTTAPPEESPAF